MPALVFLFILGTAVAAVALIFSAPGLLLVVFALYLPLAMALAVKAGNYITKDLK